MAVVTILTVLVILSVFRITCSQTITFSQNGCTYTFAVPNENNGSCSSGLTAGSSNETLKRDALSAIVRDQQYQLSQLTQSLLKLEEQVVIMENKINAASNASDQIRIGTNYIRWGRKACPDTAILIYEGYSAKSYYTHSGGGVDYICLDKNPQWPDVKIAGFQSGGYIHGVEYETLTGFDSSIYQDDAPCAVCHVDGRGEHLMIPGNRTCPSSWTKEYEGLLVSQHYQQTKATYVCLDGEPEVITGGAHNKNGGLFYTVEANCGGSLPCPPYEAGFEIACVVCTR